jgi:hypothetical protein
VKKPLFLATFICLSFVTVLAQQAAIPAASGKWITIAPANSGFSVAFPGQPSPSVQPVKDQPGLEHHMLSLETEPAGYVVTYVQFNEDVTDPDAVKLLLDRGREGGLASSGGKLKSEKDIKLNGFSGREWLVDLPGGLSATARAYWVKRQLYQLIFVAIPKANEGPEAIKVRQDLANKFFESFTLISEPGN